jgi:Cof subfamily protein (haloacid dehalogenase superfamily)
MTIKAIIMDMDGTLLNSEKKISPRTKAALLAAQEEGVTLVLASGRPINGLRKFARELDMEHHDGILVAYNGAMVEDCATGEILFDHRMTAEEGRAVLEHMKKFEVRPMIDRDEYMYVNDVFDNTITWKGEPFNVMQYECRGNGFLLCEKTDLAAFADFPQSKILTFGEPEYLKAHYEEMRAPFVGKLNCVFTSDFYYEFTAMGVDKAKALQTVLEKKGFKREELIAFGDAENDATMLKLAGIGVAMGNATEELKQIADRVTLSLDDDGIAEVIEKM